MNDARVALPILLVMVPAITFVLVGAIAWAIGSVMGWRWTWAVLSAGLGALASFSWFVGLVVDRMYPREDKEDPLEFPALAEDTTAARAATTPIAVIHDSDYLGGTYQSLPVEPDKLYRYARGVLDGRGLAEAEWIGRRGLFSKSEYATLRASLVERGILAWVNEDSHSQGLYITRGGKAFLRNVVDRWDPDSIPPPRPRGNDYVL
jgi:hypothetical protein